MYDVSSEPVVSLLEHIAMFPIQSHTVHLLLQYISPPSLLVHPLPPHLLSKPLLQRHSFLHISPDTVVEYLCWPSPHSARAIELLDNFLSSSDHPDDYSVRYTSDAEHTFAHVQVVAQDEGVRMLFQWDDQDGWKYHDTQLMPFPPRSHSTLEQATSMTDEGVQQPAAAVSVIAAASDNEDDYWNAYGVPSEFSTALPPRNAKDGSGDSEDAYWAQYSSVQGSADSTMPSPLPNNRKLQPAPPTYYHDVQYEGTVPIPVDAIHSLPLGHSKFEPPSPTALTNLLKIISPRKDTFAPMSDEPPPSLAFDHDTPSPLSTVDNSDLVTPVSGDLARYALIPPVEVRSNDFSLSDGRHTGNRCGDDAEASVEEDKAFSESIKGIYHLWKARKWKQAEGQSGDAFLRIVRAAITQP